GRLVADLRLEHPSVNVTSTQASAENSDAVDLKSRGWQRLLEVYPLKINRAVVTGGTLEYRDVDSGRTLALDHVAFSASNIRHVDGRVLRYPSPFRLTAGVFGKGRLDVTGHADFLLRPHAAIYALAELVDAPLGQFGPIVDDYRLKLDGGTLGLKGQVELRPEAYIANLQHVTVDGLKLDVLGGQPTADSTRAAQRVVSAAKAVDRAPEIRLRLQSLRVRGDLGYVLLKEPEFRVYLKEADLKVSNWSNRAWQGDTNVALTGLFMGSGRARMQGVWHPGPGAANFAVDARVVDTRLSDLNDLLRHYGRLDVSDGRVSVYTQVYARDGALRGYVKPLFRDVDVLTPEDSGDSPLHRFYEFVVEKVAGLLENDQREEVASVADLSGDLSDPDISAWQVVGNLLKNAFIDAILPGFDRERDRKVTKTGK
ncbi:MAG: DUF748 domain-containing protein, partial [Gammaproteobacteria bacterium]